MRTAVSVGSDRRLVQRLSAEFGLSWVPADGAVSVDLVVVDLAGPHGVDEVSRARTRWPAAVIAGYLTMPDAETWIAGQRAGCDVVANRGALTARLRPLLAGTAPGRRTFPLLSEADLAGRLGLVARVDQTPVGPVAIYQVDGRLCAVVDRCPHAGAALSDGELDHGQVTCPGHGSQFDVCTGERTRGPADADIATFPVVVASGQVSIVLSDR